MGESKKCFYILVSHGPRDGLMKTDRLVYKLIIKIVIMFKKVLNQSLDGGISTSTTTDIRCSTKK